MAAPGELCGVAFWGIFHSLQQFPSVLCPVLYPEPCGNFPCKCDKFFRAGLLRKRKGRLKMLCEPLKPLVASPV